MWAVIAALIVLGVTIYLNMRNANQLREAQQVSLDHLTKLAEARNSILVASAQSLLATSQVDNTIRIEQKIELTPAEIEHLKILDNYAGREERACTVIALAAITFLMGIISLIVTGKIHLPLSGTQAKQFVGFPCLAFFVLYCERWHRVHNLRTLYEAVRQKLKIKGMSIEPFSLEPPSKKTRSKNEQKEICPKVSSFILEIFSSYQNLLMIFVFGLLAVLTYFFAPTTTPTYRESICSIDLAQSVKLNVLESDVAELGEDEKAKKHAYEIEIAIMPRSVTKANVPASIQGQGQDMPPHQSSAH